MIRPAFVLAGRTGAWLGGLNYYRNLLRSIRAVETELDPVLFVGHGFDLGVLEGLGEVETHRHPMLDRRNPAWASRTLWRGGLACDRPLGRLLERHRVDLMSHSGHLARYSGIPALGWVPDLQHRRLPELFGKPMWYWRDAKYRALARFADHLVVSAHAGLDDLYELAPVARGKTSVLRFVVEPVARELQPELDELRERYALPERFFYLPNQFWQHKNHRLVIDALRLLREDGREVHVVATGVQYDRRNPRFFDELMQHAREGGVAGGFRALGVVPYPHVAGLLRESVALVNPSLFEGWSTTVEEAKSMGKRVLLSSIPVHREQDPPGGAFFETDDAPGLAELLWREWTRGDEAGDRQLLEEARTAFPERRRGFVADYEAAVRRTLEAHG